MNRRFVVRLAAREGRSALRRIGVFMASIALGVGALVTIHSFRQDVARSLDEEAEALLGADVRLGSGQPFQDSVVSVIDSLRGRGRRTAGVTTVASMVQARPGESVRLLQVRGIDGAYPFYGEVETVPAGLWDGGPPPGSALVDPAALIQLGVEVGDTLVVGEVRLPIAGRVEDLPADLGFQTAVGPRVHIRREDLERAGILGFGSLARYEAFLELPDADERTDFVERNRALIRRSGASLTTARAEAEDLTEAVRYLGDYLGLVGLGALLLGGVGVASAIHVYVSGRLSTVAILRCLGARQNDVFLVYLLQAGALGLAGSALGASLGIVAQFWLPDLLAGVVPVEVTPRLDPATVVGGLAIGVWVSVLFALAPLLTVRDVPPLRALRRAYERPARRGGLLRAGAYAAVVASVVMLSVLEAPEADQGLAFAGGLALAGALLWVAAAALMALARRAVPRWAGYPVRQGVANLFRPRNQTVAVTLALGLGAFVVGTTLQVQRSFARELSFETDEGRPNLILFDVQPDQTAGVLELLPPSAAPTVTPIVSARLAALNGREARTLLSDTSASRPEAWAVRREYRHTFRPHVADTEEVIAGRWFDDLPARGPGDPVRVSAEVDVAESLGVVVGDTVTWNVSGVEIVSVIASLRLVDWNQFATNFFFVFEPGAIDDAPRMDVVLASIPDDDRRAAVQRDLVGAFPNVSSFDVDRVQEAVRAILGKVDTAIRFLALASAVAGLLVMAGSLATSRYQRMREIALLKTLGAKKIQVTKVLLTEYVALGSVGALAGLLLAVAASSWIVREVFEFAAEPFLSTVVWVWGAAVALTVVVGLAGSRSIVGRAPLPVLRDALEG